MNRQWARCFLAVAAGGILSWQSRGNPAGGTVLQGSAAFNGLGTGNLTITTSANAFINWQSFDILQGQTTTFVQPSSSSVVWNQISSPAASQIAGTLTANGYVILQNPNGFYVGGSASISAHGLVMTTASPSQVPDLSSAGAWVFNAAPPTAKIINYGAISVDRNSSAFLIANDVENNGTISAPQGKIGLYAGQSVLVSTRPDGRGLSARVTLPAGSVDNTGKLTADGGSIVMEAAQLVNNGGVIQANSAANVNGVIELIAGKSLTLSGTSSISATGDASTGDPSPGGFVVMKSSGTYSDSGNLTTSTIDVSGANGGQGGLVEVFGTGVSQSSVHSTIDNPYATLYNPNNITLSTSTSTGSANPTLSVGALVNYGQIDLFANNNITLSSSLSLVDPGAPGALSLSAGNNITLNTGTKIIGVNDWDLNLSAGNGIYLSGTAQNGSSLTTANGDIDLYAGKEVQIGWTGSEKNGVANSGIGSITTTGGGNISVTAVSGDVNTGSGNAGYIGNDTTISPNLGGISTAAGGNVTITAGGNVTSYLPSGATGTTEAGSGAYGSAPGNVTIAAGGSVYGHYVEANGVGSITAENGNVGAISVQGANANSTFALSLINGSWDVEAPNGSIYLQEVRNPNGVFDTSTHNRVHLFDYSPTASVSLNAGNAVVITGGGNMPRPSGGSAIPIVLPPSLEVTAGSGGFTLYSGVTLFQSPYGNVDITTLNGGNFIGVPSASDVNPQFFMSDSANPVWSQANPLTVQNAQHASSPTELNNPNPVVINVSGSLNNVDIYTTKETQITVGGNMNNANFIGENLHPSDVSFVDVAGRIFYSPYYSFETLNQGINIIPFGQDDPLTTPTWDSIFYLLVDPSVANNLVIPTGTTAADLANYYNYLASLASSEGLGGLWAFPTSGSVLKSNPGFIYNSSTLRFGYGTPMAAITRDWLDGWNGSTDGSGNKVFNTTTINGVTYGQLFVLQFDPKTGLPMVDSSGHLELAPVTFVSQNAINSLYTSSQNNSSAQAPGIQIGGPGKLVVNAGSLDLGDSQGIDSWGGTGPVLSLTSFGNNYDSLAALTAVGASVNVDVAGNLDMLTSRIASMFGGDITVTAGGSMDLGSPEVPPGVNANAYGIYTTGGSDVKVVAGGNINIDGSRIATFNGGIITVESLTGNVDAGSGGNTTVTVPLVSSIPLPGYGTVGPNSYYLDYPVYGSGVVATSLPQNLEAGGKQVLPGDITISAPRGNITASDAGILQYALDGSTAGGPKITLEAGTPAVTDSQGNIITPAIPGNIDFGHAGILGGTVDLFAQGNVTGVIISRQDSTVNTSGNFTGTLLSGGTAGISAGGSISGTVVGIGGVNASGGGGISATLLGQNVSVNGGASQSTLGSSSTATTTSSSASSEASDSSKQQVASNDNGEDEKKKKKGQGSGVTKHSSRVTVILPKPM